MPNINLYLRTAQMIDRNSSYGAYGQSRIGGSSPTVGNIFERLSNEPTHVECRYIFNINEIVAVLEQEFSKIGSPVLETLDSVYLTYQQIMYILGCDNADGASIYDTMIDLGMPSDMSDQVRDILHDTVVSMLWSVMQPYSETIDANMSNNDLVITVREPNPTLVKIEEYLQSKETQVDLIDLQLDKSINSDLHPVVTLEYNQFK